MFETPGRIEPCFFEEHIPASLADLSVEIQREAAVLGQGLHPDSAAELADLVRVMNCYYSNLIEGHNTRPRDIERALAGAERTARNTLSKLTSAGYLSSASPKTPVRLAFPLDYRERLFPKLFADGDLPA